MKRVFIFIVILSICSFTYNGYVKETIVVVKPESKLIIKGTTNINKFNCHFNISKLQNPIPVNFEVKNNKMIFDETYLILKNDCFDCGNKNINKDFRALLKTNKYPEIFIHLNEIKKFKLTSEVTLNMEIAGIIKSYTIPVKIEDNLLVKGKLIMDINDFNLKPPKKILGLIKVNSTIEIDFQLLLKEH